MTNLESPSYVYWNFTYRCNLECRHCYSRSEVLPDDPSPEVRLDVARRLADAHIFEVGLGGGEPLLVKQIYDIVQVLSGVGTYVNVTTNGYFVNEANAARLQAAGLGRLYVSFDGTDPETNDGIRGAGAFKRALAAVRVARDAGLDIALSAVLGKHNHHTVDRYVAFAADNGVGMVQFKKFRPVGNGSAHIRDYLLSSADSLDLWERINALPAHSGVKVQYFDEELAKLSGESCPCGRLSLTVRPNGDLGPCPYAPLTIGNLLTDDLREIWTVHPALLRMRNQGTCAGAIPSDGPYAMPKTGK